MYLEIVSPEEILLSSDVVSVSVPGINGAFQILDNHAPIVSILREGDVKIDGNIKLDKKIQDKFSKDANNQLVFHISGGVIEMKDNKAIVLVD